MCVCKLFYYIGMTKNNMLGTRLSIWTVFWQIVYKQTRVTSRQRSIGFIEYIVYIGTKGCQPMRTLVNMINTKHRWHLMKKKVISFVRKRIYFFLFSLLMWGTKWNCYTCTIPMGGGALISCYGLWKRRIVYYLKIYLRNIYQ